MEWKDGAEAELFHALHFYKGALVYEENIQGRLRKENNPECQPIMLLKRLVLLNSHSNNTFFGSHVGRVQKVRSVFLHNGNTITKDGNVFSRNVCKNLAVVQDQLKHFLFGLQVLF